MARVRSALLVSLALLVPAACSDGDGDPEAASASASGSEAESSTTTERSTTSTTAGSTTTTAGAGAPTSTTTPAGPGVRLTGDGTGSFAYDIFPERSQLCYRMEVDGIGTGTAARIERGGSRVVDLIAPESGDTINTCVASDGLTLEQIAAAPGEHEIVVQGSDGRLAATLT